jgi:hypothetical protein
MKKTLALALPILALGLGCSGSKQNSHVGSDAGVPMMIGEGGECSTATCGAGLSCDVSHKCVKPAPPAVGEGGDCSAATCVANLSCDAIRKCVVPPANCSKLAGPCSALAICCAGLACGGDGTCVQPPPSCSAAGDSCAANACCAGLACDSASRCAALVPTCTAGTIAIAVALDGTTAQADTLSVSLTRNGKTLYAILAHQPGDAAGRIEIAPAPYVAGQTISIAITATLAGAPVGEGELTNAQLAPLCTSFSVEVNKKS